MLAWSVVAVPALAAMALAVSFRSRRGHIGAVAVVAILATLGSAVAASLRSATASMSWGGALRLSLAVSGPARVVLVLVPAIAAPVVAYAGSYLRGDEALRRLLALLVAFVAAMELLVGAGDVLSLLIGWDLVAACSWALIGHWWRDPTNADAATEAYVTTKTGELGLFLAAGAALAGAGSLSFQALGRLHGVPLDVFAAGVLVAAMAKSAQVPFSPWLFAAMAGPTPVSALLHSATMVAAGAYALIRLEPALSNAGWFGPVVVGVGLVSAMAGGVVALVQTDLKRALAASTTAQYGLMLIAVGAASTSAATAHLVTHAAFKSLLFLGAGVAIHVAGSGDLGALRLGRAERRGAALFAVGALALAAVPPLGGAFSKEDIAAAASRYAGWAAAGVLVAGFLSALYAARLYVLAFGPDSGLSRETTGAPSMELGAMAALAAASVGLGVLGVPHLRDAFARAVGGSGDAGPVWLFVASLGAVALAFGVMWWLDRRKALLSVGLPVEVQRRVEAWLGLPALGRALVVQPVLALSRHLGAFDDRVVDAGVRGVWAVSRGFSRLLGWWGERGFDGVVEGIAALGLFSAAGSGRVDEEVVDGAVEGVAGGIGVTGGRLRRLQTGLTQHYYVIVGVGVVVAVILLAAVR